jgi:hypothetical protein
MVLILAGEILLADKRSGDHMLFWPLLSQKRPFLYYLAGILRKTYSMELILNSIELQQIWRWGHL